ncbi:MAG: hypothetical protein QY304_01710 [Candidatus Paceibacterota bacterium]|nr:MAG: hypothetical protein QY304_01710 [Candidatus Paceibacterota bacterium]
MKYSITNKHLKFLAIFFLFSPALVSAQNPTIQSLLAWAWIPLYLLLITIMGFALAFFLWGAAVFILNSGNEDKRREGRQRMLWGIVALVIMVGIGGIMWALQLGFGLSPIPR